MAVNKNLYPVFILLLLGSFLCFSIWAAMRAVESGPQVTDADYYSKGLKYTSTLLERKAATTLGWKVSTQQVGRSLLFQPSDKEGQPVRSAKGVLFMYRQEASSSLLFPLQEVDPGVYQFNLRGSMTGEISARVEFEYNGARLSRQLLLNL